MGRLWRKQRKIERRLIYDGSYYQKPKGMHWRTFKRLTDKVDEIEEQKDIVCLSRLGPFMMRSGFSLADI